MQISIAILDLRGKRFILRILYHLRNQTRKLRHHISSQRSDRQRRYFDPRHRAVEFQVGDFVFLRVSPMKGVSRFGRAGKLSLCFVEPFELIGRVGTSAYRLLLPEHMSDVHDVFHVSVLRRWVSDVDRRVSEEEVVVRPDLTFRETPERVLARDVRQLQNKHILMVRVQ